MSEVQPQRPADDPIELPRRLRRHELHRPPERRREIRRARLRAIVGVGGATLVAILIFTVGFVGGREVVRAVASTGVLEDHATAVVLGWLPLGGAALAWSVVLVLVAFASRRPGTGRRRRRTNPVRRWWLPVTVAVLWFAAVAPFVPGRRSTGSFDRLRVIGGETFGEAAVHGATAAVVTVGLLLWVQATLEERPERWWRAFVLPVPGLVSAVVVSIVL